MTPTFTINYAEDVGADLAQVRPFDRKQILDRIDEQLGHQPAQATRNKKMLAGLVPPWEHEPPVWELRVEEFPAVVTMDSHGRSLHAEIMDTSKTKLQAVTMCS